MSLYYILHYHIHWLTVRDVGLHSSSKILIRTPFWAVNNVNHFANIRYFSNLNNALSSKPPKALANSNSHKHTHTKKHREHFLKKFSLNMSGLSLFSFSLKQFCHLPQSEACPHKHTYMHAHSMNTHVLLASQKKSYSELNPDDGWRDR